MTLLCTASQISLGHKPSGQSQGWRAKRMPSGQVAQPDKKLRGLPVAQQTSHNTTASSLLANKASYHGAAHSDTRVPQSLKRSIRMVMTSLCPGVKVV